MIFLDRLSYRALQWMVAGFVLLHNLEEALTIPAYAPEVRGRLAGRVPDAMLAALDDLGWLYPSLVGATLLPAVVVLIATTGQPSRGKAWAVVFVQSLFFANVFIPHVPAAAVLSGYAPGLATAILINLPYSIYFFRRSVRDGGLSRAAVALAVGLAVPGLALGLAALHFAASR